MKEPTLLGSSTQHYRFTRLPTFHPPMIFRISVEGEEFVLHVKRTDGAGGYDPGKIIDNIKLEVPNEVALNSIQKLEGECKFWEQPTKLDTMRLDGSQWIFEDSSKGKYHIVDRWSPDSGCLYEVGTELMSLSKLKISEIY